MLSATVNAVAGALFVALIILVNRGQTVLARTASPQAVTAPAPAAPGIPPVVAARSDAAHGAGEGLPAGAGGTITG